VAGQPARTAADSSFASQAAVGAGATDVIVSATDPSGNTRTNTYRVSASGASASYTYDPNGNLLSKVEGTDTWAYTWNAENQLTKVEKNGVEVARYAYDPLGRRVEKVAGGVTASYAYDQEDVLREARGVSTLKYIHGPGTVEPLAREDGAGALTYYHSDGLASIVKFTSQGGAVVHEYRYDTWGNIEAGASEPGYAFTGREWDPEIGFHYFRARYLSASLGRFVSEDPIRYGGGANFFAYAENNPVTSNDPWGLQATRTPKPPSPTPSPTPRPPIYHRPRHTLPQVYSLCDWDEVMVFWDAAPINPHAPADAAKYKRWKDAFIDACYDSEPKGKDYRARVQAANVGMVVQSDLPSMALGCCCEKKCSK
jgi:RHS repeat-associated protein